jgi:ABC-type multidrug transport system fused ATPase/permease subunit
MILGLFLYFLLAACAALLEGIGLLMLVALFTNDPMPTPLDQKIPLLNWLTLYLNKPPELSGKVNLTLLIFFVAVVIRWALIYTDGFANAFLRRRLQESIFRRYIVADWSGLRNMRIGDAIGTNTMEAMITAKYFSSLVLVGFHLLTAAVLATLALISDPLVALALGLVFTPLIFLMKIAVSRQSILGKETAALRNRFSSDITDRYNGLFQIHVDAADDFHFAKGIQSQSALTRAEVKIGFYQAFIGSFNLLAPFIALLAFSIWLLFSGYEPSVTPPVILGLALLGVKVVGQINGLAASMSNVSRLSGSVYLLEEALLLPPVPNRDLISDRVTCIHADDIGFSVGGVTILRNINLKLRRGTTTVLSGRSGRGKTTLANILSGIYFPDRGVVTYVDEKDRHYDSRFFKARVGYVTQDIYLFQGTLRENLTSGRKVSDSAIWDALERVDAADFVRQRGGLDVASAEAGKALSGGQKRRLGVVRALLSGADILIFDEITAGLDANNKLAVISMIESLSVEFIVFMISHDEIDIANKVTYVI